LFAMAQLFLVGCNTVAYAPIENSLVLSAEGKLKTEIYDSTRQWFSETFVSGESVVDYEDREVGMVIGNTRLFLGSNLGIKQWAKVQLKVETKDEKLRVFSTVLEHSNEDSTGSYIVNYGVSEGREKRTQDVINNLINSLASYIEKNGGDDW